METLLTVNLYSPPLIIGTLAILFALYDTLRLKCSATSNKRNDTIGGHYFRGGNVSHVGRHGGGGGGGGGGGCGCGCFGDVGCYVTCVVLVLAINVFTLICAIVLIAIPGKVVEWIVGETVKYPELVIPSGVLILCLCSLFLLYTFKITYKSYRNSHSRDLIRNKRNGLFNLFHCFFLIFTYSSVLISLIYFAASGHHYLGLSTGAYVVVGVASGLLVLVTACLMAMVIKRKCN